MQLLKQSTTTTIQLGPFLDSTDGVTAETGLTVADTDVYLSKAGAAFANPNDTNNATHDRAGWYRKQINTTDTGTLGRFIVEVQESGALPVWREFMVVPANVFDSLVGGSDTLEVDAVAISGDTTAADNAELDYDGTGYAKANSTIGTVTTNTDLVTAAVTADAVWDEDIEAAHGTDATAGLLLRALGQGISNEAKDANLLDQIKTVIAYIEHQRGAHTHQPIGDTFYVDPVNGNTHASGNRGGISDPYSLVQDCHDNAVTDSNHDVIMLLAGDTGVTTLTEDVTLSKRYLFIRGPGRDFLWTRSGAGDTISVTADGVELSGFQLETAGTGAGDGIQCTDADFLKVQHCWINNTRGDGINILRGDNCQIHDNVFTDTGQSGAGQGIHIVGTAGTSNRNHITNNTFHACAGDGVYIEDGTTNQTYIHHNTFESCTGYGVNIGASSTDAFLAENHYGGNTSGDVNDGGTTTFRTMDEEPAKHSIATEVRLAELDAANLPADIAALNDISTAEVNAEMIDALNVDTYAEPAGVPAATASLVDKLGWLAVLARNKITQTATTQTLRNDADGADIATSTVSDNGTTFTRGEFS